MSALVEGSLFALAAIAFFMIFATPVASLLVAPDRTERLPSWFRRVAAGRQGWIPAGFFQAPGVFMSAIALAIPVVGLLRWGINPGPSHIATILVASGDALWVLVLATAVHRASRPRE